MADFLSAFGIGDGQPPSLNSAVDQFQQQNMSPSDIYTMGNSIPRTVGGIPGIGSRIPGLGNVPIPGVSEIDKILGPINAVKFGVSGMFESVHYADDLNAHHPKFKFLFKVGFYGFPGSDFNYYVHRCDKPKVRFVHQDVNYYNFRTRVLTSTVLEPLSMTFLDEIGNSVNDFFASYLKMRSGQGSGNYGIDQGWGAASSTRPYSNAYTETSGQRIIVEQIFANGLMSNRFIFINPRIETFDFDELTMEDSTQGSMATITFTYDAIECMTVYGSTIHSWGAVDLLRGGGTSGNANAGSRDGVTVGTQTSAGGVGIGTTMPRTQTDQIYDNMRRGSDVINNVPNALGGIIMGTPAGMGTQTPGIGGAIGSMLSSAGDTISQGIQGTLGAIQSGANMIFGGGGPSAADLSSPSSPPTDLGGTEYI